MSRSFLFRLNRALGDKISGYDSLRMVNVKNKNIDDLLTSDDSLKGKSVVVIGGGFSGLATAYVLALKGCKVKLLEASDTIGGRVSSKIDDRGFFTEHGAELIGLNHEHWIRLAKRFELSFSVITTEDYFWSYKLSITLQLEDETIRDPEILKKILDDSKIILTRINKDAEDVKINSPWECSEFKKWDEISVSGIMQQWRDDKNENQELKRVLGDPKVCSIIKMSLENNQALSIDEQSYLGLLLAVKGGGGSNYWSQTEAIKCANGNQELADQLYKKIISICGKDSVELNHYAYKVEIAKENVKIHSAKKNQLGNIDRFENTHNYVVFAIPPSVWHKVPISFSSPAKENEFKDKLNKLNILGSAIKGISKFKDKFWVSNELAPAATSYKIGMLWESTDNQMFRKPTEDIVNPQFTKNTIPTHQNIFGINIFLGGPVADNAIQSKYGIKKFLTKGMQEVYGKKLNTEDDIEIDMKVEDWTSKEWIKGGYYCPKVGYIFEIAPFLSKPFDGRLIFAGEHTSLAFFGYMEGALSSGFDAVRKILKLEGKFE